MKSRIQRENKTLVLVSVMGTSAGPKRPIVPCLPGCMAKEQDKPRDYTKWEAGSDSHKKLSL